MALSSVREKTGWRIKEVDCDATTLSDLLKLVETHDGGTLYDLLVEGDRMNPGYMAFLNGKRIFDLQKRLEDGDQVAAMEFVRAVVGG